MQSTQASNVLADLRRKEEGKKGIERRKRQQQSVHRSAERVASVGLEMQTQQQRIGSQVLLTELSLEEFALISALLAPSLIQKPQADVPGQPTTHINTSYSQQFLPSSTSFSSCSTCYSFSTGHNKRRYYLVILQDSNLCSDNGRLIE